jgi:hypothetical protein
MNGDFMKKLLVGFLTFLSISAFAEINNLDFDRGFKAGALTCNNEIWSCKVTYFFMSSNGNWYMSKWEEGFSRAEALKKLLDTGTDLVMRPLEMGKLSVKRSKLST